MKWMGSLEMRQPVLRVRVRRRVRELRRLWGGMVG